MRVLLISANTEPINMPIIPLGLGCVAEAVRCAGHEVELVDLMRVSDACSVIKNSIERFGPDVIGISVRNIDDQHIESPRFLLDQVRDVIADCRAFSDARIVIGGAGYSIFPKSALAYLAADIGIQGEGEIAFPSLLARMEKGADIQGIPGLYLPGRVVQDKRKFAKKLDSLPLPDANLWSPSAASDPELWMPVQSRRGCPMNCSYCSTAAIEGRIIRKRSPALVVASIAVHVEAGFERFYFTDNTFNIPLSYAKEICRELIAGKLGIYWRCIFYPGKTDKALVEAMAIAGCQEVALGFESGSRQILRAMNKKFSPEDVRRTSDMLAQHGIRRMGFLLLGGPGETKESVEESLAFADSLQLETVKVTIGIRIYPETALAKTALREGVITRNDDLLFPRFYVVKGLEDWLRETVKKYMAERPNWIG
ncbi:MAG: radical SAM protein [Desulfobacterales bacterium]|nr:radical SAM protein [Desulfobacterales bacterium]